MVKKIGETIGVPRMRQSEVAKELGVTTAGISDMSKKDYIPADTMLRWAKRRKVSVDWLLDLTETDTEKAHVAGKEHDMVEKEALYQKILDLNEDIKRRDEKMIEMLVEYTDSLKSKGLGKTKKRGA